MFKAKTKPHDTWGRSVEFSGGINFFDAPCKMICFVYVALRICFIGMLFVICIKNVSVTRFCSLYTMVCEIGDLLKS